MISGSFTLYVEVSAVVAVIYVIGWLVEKTAVEKSLRTVDCNRDVKVACRRRSQRDKWEIDWIFRPRQKTRAASYLCSKIGHFGLPWFPTWRGPSGRIKFSLSSTWQAFELQVPTWLKYHLKSLLSARSISLMWW